jgi:hypothetical protein
MELPFQIYKFKKYADAATIFSFYYLLGKQETVMVDYDGQARQRGPRYIAYCA